MHQLLGPLRLLAAAAILAGGTFPAAAAPGASIQAGVSKAYGKLPLSFEANEGQTDKAVDFLSRGQGYTLFLTPTEAVLRLSGRQHETAVVRLQMAGGNRHPRVTGESLLATRSNYFLGNDPRRWHTGVPSYARVRYAGVYPGVDLIYRENRRQLEYDLVIAPHADPGRIRLAFRGADTPTIGAQGELILHTADGELVQPAPEVYQEAEGRRQRVAGHYVLLAAGRVGFAVGRYDRTRPLVIDPVLAYSTFLGGSGFDAASAVAIDADGNVYVTGNTNSTDFPGAGGSSIQPAFGGTNDAFVTKINAAGTAIVYSTYLGSGGNEFGNDIAVDSMGNAYITGSTDSATFPGVTATSIQPSYAGVRDAFVTKINATGTAIVYSTFLGGSGLDQAHGIAVDGAGNAYVTGRTKSTTFPGVDSSSLQPANGGGDYDIFVTRINPAGTAIVYSTFLGGSGADYPYRIAVDGAGNAYLTGFTNSGTFPGVSASSLQPAYGGGGDAFLTKIDPAGTALIYSTFLGGSGVEEGHDIAVDGAGNAYVTGATNSGTFPGVGAGSLQPAYSGGGLDAFVTKIDPAGTAIVYSTFLGGSGLDEGSGIAVDGAGNAYVTGDTSSATFPGVGSGSIQPSYGGGDSDGFLTKINATGISRVYSTFLGGSGVDSGSGVAVDAAGSAYVAGSTSSATFPGVDSGSLQPANVGDGRDGFVTKIDDPGLSFFTLTPCRLVDTRNADGPLGGPALQPGAARIFVVTGACGVPSSAKALSVNLTVTQATAAGYLRLLPGDQSVLPAVSAINYAPGLTRANNALALLAYDASGGLLVVNGSSGSVHFILDVNGYFE